MHTQEIKADILKMKCAVHNQSPTIVFTNNELLISTCCVDFRLTVLKALKELKEKFKQP